MNTIKIYTDGACRGNQNENAKGGYGAVILNGKDRIELKQGYADTTNNRMELRAIIAGLKAIDEPSKIEIISDSAYALGGFRDGWVAKWLQNGWKNSSKKPVENRDLWEELIPLEGYHEVTWTKVKGHSGNTENERADELACAAADSGELFDDTLPTNISHLIAPSDFNEAGVSLDDSTLVMANRKNDLDKGRMIRLTGLSVLQAMKERAEEILAPDITGAFVLDHFAEDGTYALSCGFMDGEEELAPDEHLSVVFNARVIWSGVLRDE